MKNVKCADNINYASVIYYVALAFKSVAIAMPHAFLTLIFLNKGMNYSQIATIQAFYSLGVVAFEYPSGILADKYPKKYLYFFSSLLLMTCYLLVLNTNKYALLILAWLIYGISTAMETGTIDADIIIWIKEKNCNEDVSSNISKFVGLTGQISSLSAIIGSCIGFLLYKIIDLNIYWVMFGLVLINGLLVALFFKLPNTVSKAQTRNIMQIVKDSLKEVKENKILKYILLIFALLQMFLQIHYQLWQSLFIEYGINPNWFIVIYLVFQFITVVAYKVPVNKVLKRTSLPFGTIAIIAVVVMYVIHVPIIKVILYCVPIFVIAVISYFTEIKFNQIVNVSNISSITSLLSTVMRIFGFAVLLIAGRLIDLFSVNILFLVVPIIAMTAICFVVDRCLICD